MKPIKNCTKRYAFRKIVVSLLTCCMLLSIYLSVAWAGPEGAEIVNGQVSIQESGYNTVITASDGSIINYSSFDILQPEIVEFIQPSSSASVLNRILSANPTNINGTLLANGRVFFVNPAGVYIGAGARINVSQLVASGLDISNSDFINGRYYFVGGDGFVINCGDILAEQVYLIGKQVANSGNISCPDGYVVMAAGDRVFLGEPGSDIVLELDTTPLPEETNPIDLEPAVLNEGAVEAAGGTIVLAAAGDIYSQAISNVGSLSVSVETDEAGQITLLASDGQITNAGTIEASGDTGGSVTIDGGDVVLTADSVIHADAVEDGAAGEVLIYADALDLDGVVTAAGTDGYILFDPDILNIDQDAADAIAVSLDSTQTLDVSASVAINLDGEINSSGQTNDHTLNFKEDDYDDDDDLTINLSKSIILGDNQTLTGDGTTVNVLSEDASIQNGIDVSAAGAIITVSDGTYTEDLTVDKSGLTLKSVNGRDYTTIELDDGVGINIGSGGSGFTLGGGFSDGFEIVSGGATTYDIQLTNAPSDVEISWNTIDTTGNASMGVSVGAAGATGLDINNNIFTAGDLGDGSIWGPDMVDVLVTENTFTGPEVHAALGYAVQFAGVTGTSAIQDNTISNYGMGIIIHNGTGTSGLTISGNDISNSSNGIRFYQYSPSGINGDMTTVTIENNKLTDNKIGLRVGDGANVLAGNFIIQNNSFSGNTTGLVNEHTSEDITAMQNYWGDVDGPGGIGPGSGDPITAPGGRDVDYSPWWGGDYIGDAHTGAWTWGTDDSIQDAIDLASTTVSDRIYIASGIYAEMLDVNKQLDGLYFRGDGTVSSEIDGTVTLNANLDIYTQNDGDLTLNTINDGSTHSLLVDTGSGTLNLDENITANGGITLDGGIINVGNDTGDKITSDGAVSIVGTGAVAINAAIEPSAVAITSNSDLTINNSITADDLITAAAGLVGGVGNVTINSTGALETTAVGSDIQIAAGATTGDISLAGNVTAADEVTMTALGGSILDTGSGMIAADSASLSAKTEIGSVVNSVNTSVSSLTANAGGNIYINEMDGLTSADLHSTTGDIDLTAGDTISTSILTADAGNVDAETTAGDIDNTTVNASGTADLKAAGSINNASVTAGPTATLIAGADISEFNVSAASINMTATAGMIADTDGLTDLTGTNATLNAGTSTGSAENPVNTEIVSLIALAAEDIYIHETDAVELVDIDTSDGDIHIKAGAQMTATDLEAGGTGDIVLTTTGTGDVIIDEITALNDMITIDSAGMISEVAETEPAVDLTAYELDLDAESGIYGSSPIETSTEIIAADTTNGDIDIDNVNANPVTAGSLTTGNGNILFSQSGGGSLSVTSSSTQDGSIVVDVTGAPLTALEVTAGGTGNILLRTAGTGNVIVDEITAMDNTITIDSAGAIEESGEDTAADLTAYELNLDAESGIYGSSPIETSAEIIAADTTNGDIDIDNVNANPVTAGSLTTGNGNILFSQSGGGSLEVTTASTSNGNVELDITGADANLKVGDITAGGSGNVDLKAAEGKITQDSGTITANGGYLTMTQRDALDTKDFTFTNQVNTDITLQSYNGSVTAVDLANGGKDENAADKWKSITATAEDNIVLQGNGDIKIGGDLTSASGGVSIISDNGGIYDAGSYNYTMMSGTVLDNVNITGYSDGTAGVDLPAGSGKAAIIIQSKKDLKLGQNCNLTADGSYDPTSDERQDVIFELDGDPIDIAIYLSSFDSDSGTGANVDIGSSRISINNSPSEGTLVIDAYDTVTFTDTFENSLKLSGSSNIKRIEATSRITPDLQSAINLGTLPHADNPAGIANGEFVLSGGVYVLRGPATLLAKASILALTGPVPLVPPVPLEVEDRGEVEEDERDALMQWLVEELGESNVQTYLARAYPPSLNTDLRPYKAAARLRNFATIIKDTQGEHIAALTQVVNEFIATPIPPSEEQMALIVSALTEQPEEGTHYAAAGQWIEALVEYTGVLSTEIGWSSEKSVAFVMSKYGSRLTESGDIRAAMFVQMYIEESFGG
jgi:fibronectin-binding autotransporter adhesin